MKKYLRSYCCLCVYKNYKNSVIQLQEKYIKARNIVEKEMKAREKRTKEEKDRKTGEYSGKQE
jgi:hypothetical protein